MKTRTLVTALMLSASLTLMSAPRNYVGLVNTMQGTENSYELSHGRCRPTVGLPHSMHLWTPAGTGFASSGFSFVVSSENPGDDFVMPRVTPYGKKPYDAIAAMPHYFKAGYESGAQVEATATEHCGMFRIRFSKSGDGYVTFSAMPGSLKLDTTGRVLTFKNGQSSSYVVFSKTPEKVDGSSVVFRKGSKVVMSVSFSSLGEEQAEVSWQRELAGKGFDDVVSETAALWNGILGQIEIEGGTSEQQRTFYSCLYRANLNPVKLSEVDADGVSHYMVGKEVHEGYYHIHNTFWDVAKCQLPLQNILNVKGQKEYLQSLGRCWRISGWLPNGMIGNHASSVFADAWAKGIRTFDPDSALVAYFHEVTSSRLDESNEYFIEHERGVGRLGHKDYFTLGYIPTDLPAAKVQERTSRTMEYAYDDFCAYQLAKMAGNEFYETVFGRHMGNWRNVIDPADHFPKARDRYGRWDPDFNPFEWGGPFVEGNAWHYKWCVNHDIQGLVDFVGGEEAFVREMDQMLTAPCDSIMPGGYGEVIHEITEVALGRMGQYAPGNEPTFHVLYLYDYAGQPWRTQELLRHSLATHFDSSPEGFPGDEDAGSMSSFYVFSAMGFYPVTPGVPQYALGSPLFNKVTIHLENGKDFVVSAPENSSENVYIDAAELNGGPLDANWITHDDIMSGGTLRLKMSDTPNKARGISEESKPYSVSRIKD